jgi:hypothetical protein
VIKRPTKNEEEEEKKKNKNKKQQNLCLDKGYHSAAEIQCQVLKRRYIPNIPQRGEKKKYIEKRKEEGDGW